MRQTKEMRRVYSDFLAERGLKNKAILAIEADLSSSMTTDRLKDCLGKRYINVGIMEQQMIGLAAGAALYGYKPYIHSFGPFVSRRVFDQVFISLAYAQLDATIIGSDAGVTAEMNGGTHMPFEDLALMRLIPKASVYEVSDDVQFAAVLEQTETLPGLKYIRTIRKSPQPIYQGDEDFSQGYQLLAQGHDLTLLASGIMVTAALEVADYLQKEGLSIGVIDLFRVKPINPNLEKVLEGRPVLTLENHNLIGGLGSATSDLLSSQKATPVYRMGVDESFGQVGQSAYLLERYRLSPEDIKRKIKAILAKS